MMSTSRNQKTAESPHQKCMPLIDLNHFERDHPQEYIFFGDQSSTPILDCYRSSCGTGWIGEKLAIHPFVCAASKTEFPVAVGIVVVVAVVIIWYDIDHIAHLVYSGITLIPTDTNLHISFGIWVGLSHMEISALVPQLAVHCNATLEALLRYGLAFRRGASPGDSV